MTPVDFCKIVVGAEMRPFGKTDYYAWAGVSRDGPHEIGQSGEWTVVRDGIRLEISRSDEHGEVTEGYCVEVITLI